MSLFRRNVITEEDKERVHEAALTVLSKGRAMVQDEKVLKELGARGAKVDEHSGHVSLPRTLVAEALQNVQKKPVMYRVSGKRLDLYGQNRYWRSLNVDPIIVDYNQGMRKPVVDDVARHARLSDALGTIDMIYKMEQPCADVPERISEFETLAAYISNTTTAYECAPATMECAHLWLRVAELMSGGSLEENPILMGDVAIISPFLLDQAAVDMMRLFLERGVVLRIQPCPISGSTSPYSIAGTLVQGWAELLFQLVVTLVLREDARVSVAIAAAGLNMRTFAYLGGGVVNQIVSGAALEMTEKFGLSASFGAFTTLCSNYGLQNGVESTISSLITLAGPGNHLPGAIGTIANATGIAPEQILFHHDLIQLGERLAREVDFSEEKLAVDSIISVGARGNFLTEPMTIDMLRTDEHFQVPDFVYAAAGEDKETLAENLHQRAEELMNTHKPAVPQDRLEKALDFLTQEKKRVS